MVVLHLGVRLYLGDKAQGDGLPLAAVLRGTRDLRLERPESPLDLLGALHRDLDLGFGLLQLLGA